MTTTTRRWTVLALAAALGCGGGSPGGKDAPVDRPIDGGAGADRATDAAAGTSGGAGTDAGGGAGAAAGANGGAGAGDASVDASGGAGGGTADGGDASDRPLDMSGGAGSDAGDTAADRAPDAPADRAPDAPADRAPDAVADASKLDTPPEAGPSCCGASCSVCPGTTNGDATCVGGGCGLACRDGFTACSTGCCRGFFVERVDAPLGGGGAQPSTLTFDAAGTPHVVYYDNENFDILYATRVGGVWKRERIMANAFFLAYNTSLAIAVDALGEVHVAATPTEVLYAHRAGGVWTVETVDTTAAGVSLAVDAARTVHLSYGVQQNTAAGHLAHASRAVGGAWVREVVDADDGVGSQTSVALDAQGRPRIAYLDFAHKDLKLATWNGTAWALETVERAGDVGFAPSLALDAQGRPRIAYVDGTVNTESVRYAEWTGSAWTLTSVLAMPTVGFSRVSLALDSAGVPWVGWYATSPPRPALWHRPASTWVQDTFAPDPGGRTISLARDGAGAIEAIYGTGNYGDSLLLARPSAGGWTQEMIDELVEAGEHSAMALDGAARPHISYLNRTRSEVWYATRDDAGVWTRRFVANAGTANFSTTGGYTAIAVETNGKPHVVWYDGAAANLQHATWNGTSWVKDVVDANTTSEPWPSAAMGPGGDLRLVYTAPTGLTYAVAGGGSYAKETITGAGGWGHLALDAAGAPHVSSLAGAQFVYAHKVGATWMTEPLGAGKYDFPWSNITVDGNGNPHVCWGDSPSYSVLHYATRAAGGGWTKAIPPYANQNVGFDCSIAVDAQNQPMIVHQGPVRLTKLVGGTWVDTPIELFTVLGTTAIIMDAQGTPHIMFRNSDKHRLEYAVGR